MKAAINIARFTAADPFAGLADRIGWRPNSRICRRVIRGRCPSKTPSSLARATEAAGQAVDARVNNSEGASVNTNLSQFVHANSHGFATASKAAATARPPR